MYPSRRPRLDPNEPIWLIVQRDSRFRAFELAPDSKACVSFGSASTATVRLEVAAPIAFTLERDAGGLWLVPGYASAELRVDTLRVEKAQLIHGRAVVELGGVRLVLGVRDTPPTLRGGMVELDDSTLSDWPRTNEPLAESELARTAAVGHSLGILFDETTATVTYTRAELAGIDPSFGDTREHPAMDFEGWLDSPEPVPVSRITESSRTEELDAYALRMALAQQPQPSAPPEPLPKSESAPGPVRLASGDTTSYDAAALKHVHSLAQVAPRATAEQLSVAQLAQAGRPSLLELLGLLTKRHPVGVISGAAFGSLFIIVFMVGVAHLLGTNRKATTVATPPKAADRPIAVVAVRPKPQESARAAARLAPLSSGSAAPTVAEGTTPVEEPAVATAAGHLFAGRLAEAETAYRELSDRHPEVASYAILARMLGRRNSEGCRSTTETKKLCPMVKQ